MLALLSSPLFILLVIFLILAFVLYVILSHNKKKKAKIEKVFKREEPPQTQPDTTETSTETMPAPETDENKPDEDNLAKQESSEEADGNNTDTASAQKKKKKKTKYIKQKPQVEQVFKRTETTTSEEVKEVKPDISEDELLGRMQFVSTSKKISKLKSLTEDEQAQLAEAQRVKLAEQISGLDLDPIELPPEEYAAHEAEQKKTHFDRSRRISRCIECGSFDDMFCTHITDRYLNIDVDKHLNLNDEFTKSLYSRTSEMLANSNAKINSNETQDSDYDEKVDFDDISPRKRFASEKDSMKDWLEKRRREEMAKLIIGNDKQAEENNSVEIEPDDLNLSAKNIMLVSSIMNRKSAKKNV